MALLDELMESLRCLPGVGPKSAQRMAFHLLDRDREGGLRLAEALARAVREIGQCQLCRNFTEAELCELCVDARRDASLVCVVENSSDVVNINRAAGFRGRFFVLHGRISPMDGIGPAELGLERLAARLREEPIAELILATSTTMEGEATAHYLCELADEACAGRTQPIAVSRLAHGIPLGGDLDYVDGGTLAHALNSRMRLPAR